ncbi:MAG: polysaccharide biosynthesis tyrosine autokinase [Bacteroides sp.]|nr:polysaccharide biosynthesis tyrosine autokinase [Bacteroides sp.]
MKEQEKELKVTSGLAEEKSINLVDIFMYLLSYWKWFLVSILVFGGYFWYDYCKTPFMYNRSAVVMIKTPANTQGTMRMNRYNSFMSGPVNVASEILQFKSKELMRKVVSRLDADVSYTVRNGLRHDELYRESPIKVSFIQTRADDYLSFQVIPVDSDRVILSDLTGSDKKMTISLKDTIDSQIGKFVVEATDTYGDKWMDKTITVTKLPRDGMVGYFLSNLAIEQMDDDASLLQMSIQDKSALRTADMLDMLIAVYNEEAIEDKNKIAINTAEFIKGRLAVIEKDLGTVESDIERLKSSNEGLDVSTTAGMYIADAQQSQSEIKGVDAQLQLMQFMQQHLMSIDNTDKLIPNNTGLVDDEVESRIIKYNNLVLKRNRLVEGRGSNNPVVQELNRSLQVMRQDITRAVDNRISTLKVKQKEADLQKKQVRQKMQALPELQRKMLSVERQQKVKEELYLFLLNKREENALNQAMTDNNARVLDSPSGSNSPVYPSKYRKLLMGMGCGVAFPAIVVLMMLMLDTRVRGRKDIEAIVSAPFLCEIPQVTVRDNKTSGVRVSIQGRDHLSEAFRILRTNLGFMMGHSKNVKVITLTSFNVGAGKTFIAINLAACLAQMQKKVIIVDLDLRKGTMSALINAKHHSTGIIHYLTDADVTADGIIHKDVLESGVDIIPVGTIAPNPTELLLSERLDELIAELKNMYDYVIVDNVPMGLVADAAIVDRISELTLFVVRAGKLDRRQLPELERIYRERKLKNLAILLNGSKKGSRGYGYGYGYGYGNEDQKGVWNKIKNLFK